MGRAKQTTKTATKRRTRKAKPVEQPAPATEYTPKEIELRQKCAHDILPQSYRVAGAEDRPGWGKKHTVLVRCANEECAAEPRCVATSDLQFDTTRYCLQHSKILRANRRRTREVKKSLK